jgi:hypothetical protein
LSGSPYRMPLATYPRHTHTHTRQDDVMHATQLHVCVLYSRAAGACHTHGPAPLSFTPPTHTHLRLHLGVDHHDHNAPVVLPSPPRAPAHLDVLPGCHLHKAYINTNTPCAQPGATNNTEPVCEHIDTRNATQIHTCTYTNTQVCMYRRGRQGDKASPIGSPCRRTCCSA